MPPATVRTPAFCTVSELVPVPHRPIAHTPLASHRQPATSMTTVPDEPASRLMRPWKLETAPPAVMLSTPMPLLPTASTLLLVHAEPAPSTVATPLEPLPAPIFA